MVLVQKIMQDAWLEYLQTSNLTEHGTKPVKTTETRIFRRLSGEWRIWNADSNDIVGGKSVALTLRHKIAAPAEQIINKVQGPSFRVVQEKEDTKPVKTTETRIFRCWFGECSIWNADDGLGDRVSH